MTRSAGRLRGDRRDERRSARFDPNTTGFNILNAMEAMGTNTSSPSTRILASEQFKK
jgi:hypothetical protein